jgi:hypothetical protein
LRAPSGRRGGRRQLLLVASLFLVPLLAAIALYHSTSWRPATRVSGELIEPPRPLPHEALRGRWFLVYPIDGDCGPPCIAVLSELGRVRLALDKDADRVRRVLLHGDGCCGPGFPIRDEDVLRLEAAGPEGDSLRALFPPALDGERGIYIVDPHGNLIMSYPAAGSARGLLSDLERLLRLSQIG